MNLKGTEEVSVDPVHPAQDKQAWCDSVKTGHNIFGCRKTEVTA
jgi:hypothetical protein